MALDCERCDRGNQRAVRSKALTWLLSLCRVSWGQHPLVSCTVPQRREVTAWREHLRARGTIPIERLCTTQVSPTWHTAITPHRPRRHSPLRPPRHCPHRPRPYPPLGHPI